MEITRYLAGMQVVSVEDVRGKVVIFPVDSFVKCEWVKTEDAYRITLCGKLSVDQILITEKIARHLADLINTQIQTTISIHQRN